MYINVELTLQFAGLNLHIRKERRKEKKEKRNKEDKEKQKYKILRACVQGKIGIWATHYHVIDWHFVTLESRGEGL